MALEAGGQAAIICTERGLTIAGTRLTLYASLPHNPEQEALWAKLEEQKAKRVAEKQ